jgi:hypothetical protein
MPKGRPAMIDKSAFSHTATRINAEYFDLWSDSASDANWQQLQPADTTKSGKNPTLTNSINV